VYYETSAIKMVIYWLDPMFVQYLWWQPYLV